MTYAKWNGNLSFVLSLKKIILLKMCKPSFFQSNIEDYQSYMS